jgi:hypothetical protein
MAGIEFALAIGRELAAKIAAKIVRRMAGSFVTG